MIVSHHPDGDRRHETNQVCGSCCCKSFQKPHVRIHGRCARFSSCIFSVNHKLQQQQKSFGGENIYDEATTVL